MSRLIKTLSFLLAFLNTALGAQTRSSDAQAKSLVFRLTGDDAIPLRAFLQERMPQKVDYTQTKYFGDLNSLACSERNDCFLWLTRLEWQEIPADEGQGTRLAFTLPFNETILSGHITLNTLPNSERQIRLQLQDLSLRPGAWESPSKTCAATNTLKALPALQPGACRIEFSNAVKASLPYAPSVQFLQNSDNIVLSFTGTSAKQLFDSRPYETDPLNEERQRVQFGPKSYCWNLEPLLPPGQKPEAYVCQASYVRTTGLEFLDTATHSSLHLNFSSAIAQTVNLDVKGVHAGTCRIYSKAGANLRCTIFYNWKGGVDGYPLGNTVQGVAVGWGVAASDH